MKVIGLTGGIGSGKTTVANFFKDLGVPVYIADDEAKKLMDEDQGIKEQLIELFGEDVYRNGKLNRKKIAAVVFNDQKKLERLNSIIHPAVERHFDSWKKCQNSPYVIYEAAILFENGSHKKCDLNILVIAPRDVKIKRLKKRDASTLEEIEARMENQWSDEKKLLLADLVIENKDLSKTQKYVQEIHQKLFESA